MKESDFPQFSDPRVREVFAAAANLVQSLSRRVVLDPDLACDIADLASALFAAQHSRPKETSESWPCKGFAAPHHCTSEQCRPKRVDECANCGDPMAGCRGRCQDDS